MNKAKTLCKNCGQSTKFGESADSERAKLGWCNPCFVHSRRNFIDPVTDNKVWYDELRTIDGTWSPFQPK
jgi:hypothetical protein